MQSKRVRSRVPTNGLHLPQWLPAAARRSPLMQQGGFAVFDALVNGEARERWLSEALRRARRARANDLASSDGAGDGDFPLQRRRSAWGGKVQGDIYHAPWMLRFLRELTGVSPVPNSRFGGYIYYTRAGDYVGIHRDDETCEVVAITCLYDGPQVGGALCVYPSRLSEPLAAIRATPERGAVKLRLRPGQTLVMFGRIVPHAVLPVSAGQARIVSSLCYRLDLHDGKERSAVSDQQSASNQKY